MYSLANAEPPNNYDESILAAVKLMIPISTHSETTRSVSAHGPTPSLVQTTDTFFRDQLDDPSTSESLGVGLHLDLEHIEGE